jgi:hypothetical protein
MPNARSKKLAVDRLRWTLLAALSGVTAGTVACAGRSERSDTNSEAGESNDSGRGGASGGSQSKSTGGSGPSAGKGSTSGGASGSVSTGGSSSAGKGSGGTAGAPGGSGGVATGGSGGVGTGGSAGEAPEGCAAAASYTDEGGNLVYCGDSHSVNRPTATACAIPDRYGPSEGDAAGADGAAGAVNEPFPPECASDLDCVASANGFCILEMVQDYPSYRCQYACGEDNDCASSEICVCEPSYVRAVGEEEFTLGTCRTATCSTNDECESGLCLSPVDANCGTPRPGAFHCASPLDECHGPEDCFAPDQCQYAGNHFACIARPTCGRPFVVHGAARVASAIEGGGWAEALPCTGSPAELSASERAEVANHFVAAGLMEHASIAAFARFALQLLALGAPAELVADATAAMQDETRHAKLCFGLAARYGESAVAPGPLELGGAFEAVDLLAISDLVISEGCIGETGAALEVAWAAEAAAEPALRELLRDIADDELRHAALAFRFVAWAAERDARIGELFAQRVAEARAFARGRERALRPESSRGAALLARHGVLGEATRAEARRRALDEIVLPAATGLGERGRQRTSSMTVELRGRGVSRSDATTAAAAPVTFGRTFRIHS